MIPRFNAAADACWHIKYHTLVLHLHCRRFLFQRFGDIIKVWLEVLLLTILILSSDEAAVVTPLGEFTISSASVNISRKISRRSFSSGIQNSSAVTGIVKCPSFAANGIISSSFWLVIVDCLLVDAFICLAGKTSKRS